MFSRSLSFPANGPPPGPRPHQGYAKKRRSRQKGFDPPKKDLVDKAVKQWHRSHSRSSRAASSLSSMSTVSETGTRSLETRNSRLAVVVPPKDTSPWGTRPVSSVSTVQFSAAPTPSQETEWIDAPPRGMLEISGDAVPTKKVPHLPDSTQESGPKAAWVGFQKIEESEVASAAIHENKGEHSGGIWQRVLEEQELCDDEESGAPASPRKKDLQGGQDIIRMARFLGMDPVFDSHLLWIAEYALNAPLPDGWTQFRSEDGRMFYYEEATDVSQWDHPFDAYYRDMLLEIKQQEAEDDAAVAIQAVLRRFLAWGEALVAQCALVMQCVYRMYRTRKVFGRKKIAVIRGRSRHFRLHSGPHAHLKIAVDMSSDLLLDSTFNSSGTARSSKDDSLQFMRGHRSKPPPIGSVLLFPHSPATASDLISQLERAQLYKPSTPGRVGGDVTLPSPWSGPTADVANVHAGGAVVSVAGAGASDATRAGGKDKGTLSRSNSRNWVKRSFNWSRRGSFQNKDPPLQARDFADTGDASRGGTDVGQGQPQAGSAAAEASGVKRQVKPQLNDEANVLEEPERVAGKMQRPVPKRFRVGRGGSDVNLPANAPIEAKRHERGGEAHGSRKQVPGSERPVQAQVNLQEKDSVTVEGAGEGGWCGKAYAGARGVDARCALGDTGSDVVELIQGAGSSDAVSVAGRAAVNVQLKDRSGSADRAWSRERSSIAEDSDVGGCASREGRSREGGPKQGKELSGAASDEAPVHRKARERRRDDTGSGESSHEGSGATAGGKEDEVSRHEAPLNSKERLHANLQATRVPSALSTQSEGAATGRALVVTTHVNVQMEAHQAVKTGGNGSTVVLSKNSPYSPVRFTGRRKVRDADGVAAADGTGQAEPGTCVTDAQVLPGRATESKQGQLNGPEACVMEGGKAGAHRGTDHGALRGKVSGGAGTQEAPGGFLLCWGVCSGWAWRRQLGAIVPDPSMAR